MPHQEIAFRRQKALLWPAIGKFDYNGQHMVATTWIPLDVRWNDSTKEMLDPERNVVTVDASVVVDRDIPIGSILWKGSAADLTAAEVGTGTGAIPVSGVMEVVAFDKTQDIKARAAFRTVGLKRRAAKDGFPQQG